MKIDRCCFWLIGFIFLVTCHPTPESRQPGNEETNSAQPGEFEDIYITIGDYNDENGDNPPLCGGESILIHYTLYDDGQIPDTAQFTNLGNLDLYTAIKRSSIILVDDYACNKDYGDVVGCNIETHQFGAQLSPGDELLVLVEYLNTDSFEYVECENISVILP